jgi:hypothetical protein
VGHVLWILFGPGTWGAGGNLAAWVMCGGLGFLGAYLLRERIGPPLAAWWARHHGPHAIAQHREALATRQAVPQPLHPDVTARLDRMDAHIEGLAEAVRSGILRSGNPAPARPSRRKP